MSLCGDEENKIIDEACCFCLKKLHQASVILRDSKRNRVPFQEFINCIGSAVSGERICLFLNHESPLGVVASYVAEWCASDAESLIDKTEFQHVSYENDLPNCYDHLADGELLSGGISDLSPLLRGFLEIRKAEHIVIAPLFSGSEFSGFIGIEYFARKKNGRGGVDEQILRIVADNLSMNLERSWVFERMKRKNALFNTVIDSMNVIVSVIDKDTSEIIFMNKYATLRFGNSIGMKCWNVFFDDQDSKCSFCPEMLSDEGGFLPLVPWEHYFSKIKQWCLCSSQAVKWPDGRTVVLLVADDITTHKMSEKKLQQIIEEKETLFNEVHHRVKNNLQSLIYLITMQSEYVKSSNAIEILHELRERIRAMSLVHSQLYQSENLSSIDFGKYVSLLLETLMRAMSVEEIKTIIDIPGIKLDIRSAIPCGLIINELVTNIIKHAFKDFQNISIEPEMRISMKEVDGRYILKVSDNGAGFKMRSYFIHDTSLGLKLVKIWATHQLGGTLDINEEGGVEFIISFPVKR